MYIWRNLWVIWGLIAATLWVGSIDAKAAETDPFVRGPEGRRWSPVADEVYLQETGRQVASESPIESVAIWEHTLYAATEGGLFRLEGDALTPVADAPTDIHRLRATKDALWILSTSGLFRFDGTGISTVSDRAVVDLCVLRGSVYAATEMGLYRYAGGGLASMEPPDGYKTTNTTFIREDGTQVLPRSERVGPILRLASHSETLYILRSNDLILLDGDLVDPRTMDWGRLPSTTMRDLLSIGNRLYVATDRGVGVLRGMAMTTLDGAAGLPYEDTTCLAEGFEQDLWIGTTWGAVRNIDGDFHYFAGSRWLPHDRVHDIAVGDGEVFIATEKGLGIISYKPYTLRKKAAYYERWLEEWGHKRMGFTHLIHIDGATGEWIREITDNDGGFTSHYLAAMLYKYAVTGETAAWEEAVNTFHALIWLEEITPISGFPARSIWSVGDAGARSERGSGGLPARWNPTPDGNFAWKGDTSSDEVGAHYYAMTLFCELAPDGPEKERAREHIRCMTDHIVNNGWKLRDMDGELTRWGRWDPEYLQRPYGMYARGLNGMEAQAYAHTAIGLLGDPGYRDALQQLITWRYHEHTVRQKLTTPPEYITPWDDRLAFMAYYPLIRYSESDRLRALYLRSLERSWEIKRIEKHPWFNFLYGALTGHDCEAEQGVQFLREWPLDLISYSYRNSHRADLHPEPGYAPYAMGPRTNAPKAISPRESEPKKLDGTLLTLDGGSDGRRAITPNTWLESYWMGRYFGFIEAPKTDDPALTQMPDTPRKQQGAAPYEGPPRPF